MGRHELSHAGYGLHARQLGLPLFAAQLAALDEVARGLERRGAGQDARALPLGHGNGLPGGFRLLALAPARGVRASIRDVHPLVLAFTLGVVASLLGLDGTLGGGHGLLGQRVKVNLGRHGGCDLQVYGQRAARLLRGVHVGLVHHEQARVCALLADGPPQLRKRVAVGVEDPGGEAGVVPLVHEDGHGSLLVVACVR